MRSAEALASLCICADSPEPLLIDGVISTEILSVPGCAYCVRICAELPEPLLIDVVISTTEISCFSPWSCEF